ncbi:MAG: hypothetical protein R6U13_08525 [Desulfatiglandaceae bacterium]
MRNFFLKVISGGRSSFTAKSIVGRRAAGAGLAATALYGVVLGLMLSISCFGLTDTHTQQTPSIPEYFSWINNTNEGPTEEQTLINLRFFEWLHDEYGMQLGIYAFDAGTIDSQRYYGSMETERFRSQFPNGFENVADFTESFSCQLGLWGGPDGFGDTPEEEQERTDMLVKLCRDYNFRLFKLDAVCGQLRDDKQDAFTNAMARCRKYAPDLIVLNHRLNLTDESRKYTTTSLWGGRETYIDVHMANTKTATHNRQGALERGLPPNLERLTEDHGVCISSCLDFWQDDLVLQAFNRCLLLAPQIYGNPWLLRDEEFPKLARIFNLHYRNREILVNGMELPSSYGPHAVARGSGAKRFLTLRNTTWQPTNYTVRLDREIGLSGEGPVEVRRYHPSEEILGEFDYGDTIEVTVDPFRSYLLMATTAPCDEVGVTGCDYEVVRDLPGKPVEIKLLGMPGETAKVELRLSGREFERALLDGEPVPLEEDESLEVRFPGEPVAEPWHMKLGDLQPVPVPDDAEQLYEATCYAAPNDALEVQSLRRSGPTKIPAVAAARDAFFEQELFWRRGIWDRYLFDDRDETFFGVYRYGRDRSLDGGCLRLDLGEVQRADALEMDTIWQKEKEDEPPSSIRAEVSDDLQSWHEIVFKRDPDARPEKVDVAKIWNNGGKHELFEADLLRWKSSPDAIPAFRYLRLAPAPRRTAGIELVRDNEQVEPSDWHATILFEPWDQVKVDKAWKATVEVPANPAPGSYLCVAVAGEHGKNGAFASLRVGDEWVGATQRAPSFPAVVFEFGPSQKASDNTYFFPVTEEMRGREIDAMVLGLERCGSELDPEVWMTTYPKPWRSRDLTLE